MEYESVKCIAAEKGQKLQGKPIVCDKPYSTEEQRQNSWLWDFPSTDRLKTWVNAVASGSSEKL